MADRRTQDKIDRLKKRIAAVKDRAAEAEAKKLPAKLVRALAARDASMEAIAAARVQHRADGREVDKIRRQIKAAQRNGYLPSDETDPSADPQDSRPAAEVWQEDGALLVRTDAPVPGFPKAARAIGGDWNSKRWSFPAERAAEARGLARRFYRIEEDGR